MRRRWVVLGCGHRPHTAGFSAACKRRIAAGTDAQPSHAPCRSPRVPRPRKVPSNGTSPYLGSPTSDDARPDGGSVALRATGAFGATLAGKARALLIAGDLDGYRALFTRAAEQEDPSARYHARVLLLEEGLTAAGQAQRGPGRPAVRRRRQGRARRARRASRASRCILNYTGVALYELWGLDGARALFEAAQRLEPSLPHIEQNLAQLKDRRRTRAATPARCTPPLPALVARAKRVGRPRQARRRPDPQPLHDRPRRGGDAPALPRRRAPPPSTRS